MLQFGKIFFDDFVNSIGKFHLFRDHPSSQSASSVSMINFKMNAERLLQERNLICHYRDLFEHPLERLVELKH